MNYLKTQTFELIIKIPLRRISPYLIGITRPLLTLASRFCQAQKTSVVFSYGWIFRNSYSFCFLPTISIWSKTYRFTECRLERTCSCTNEVVPNQILHLQTGAIELDFPTKRKWYLKVLFSRLKMTLRLTWHRCRTITHQGIPESFHLQTPLGKIVDLGTQFGVSGSY